MKGEFAMFESMRTYYEVWYPEDPLGVFISDNCFMDLFEALDSYKDVYDVIGVAESVIRERLFKRLAELLCVSYDDIYEQWLKAA